MVGLLVQGEKLTSQRCESEFGITRETGTQDFKLLVQFGLASSTQRGSAWRFPRKTFGWFASFQASVGGRGFDAERRRRSDL